MNVNVMSISSHATKYIQLRNRCHGNGLRSGKEEPSNTGGYVTRYLGVKTSH